VILEADVRKTSGEILKRLFSSAARATPENHTAYGLWNGTDSIAPLPYLGTQFDASHTHYFASQSAVLDSQDIEGAMRLVTEHVFGHSVGRAS
jgi:hypothetical protein